MSSKSGSNFSHYITSTQTDSQSPGKHHVLVEGNDLRLMKMMRQLRMCDAFVALPPGGANSHCLVTSSLAAEL